MSEIKVSQQAREAAQEWIKYAPLAVKMALPHPQYLYEAFARFEAEIRADERERAAKVAECLECPADMLMATRMNWSRRIAAAIRATLEPKKEG